MTNSSVGTLMYKGVRSFGWIFWYWHRVKQKIGRGGAMNMIDKMFYQTILSAFKTIVWYNREMVDK